MADERVAAECAEEREARIQPTREWLPSLLNREKPGYGRRERRVAAESAEEREEWLPSLLKREKPGYGRRERGCRVC